MISDGFNQFGYESVVIVQTINISRTLCRYGKAISVLDWTDIYFIKFFLGISAKFRKITLAEFAAQNIRKLSVHIVQAHWAIVPAKFYLRFLNIIDEIFFKTCKIHNFSFIQRQSAQQVRCNP